MFKPDTDHVDTDFDEFDAVDDFGRLFDFEVRQTSRQEESATASEGFKVISMVHLKTISDGS